ncbi:anti-repressor SinI family protein [Bacillus kexueae]|nr:anti-repressor SinI family protein [Bacillus kexueae]
MEIATLRPDLDKEWFELIKEAKSIGLTPEDIKQFLHPANEKE